MVLDIRKQKLKAGEIIPLTFDYVFTAIFNNEDNIDIIENFLSCYLEVDIKEIRGKVKILPRELELESKSARSKKIDLLLDLKGEKINIELLNRSSMGVRDRNVVFACNIHGRQLKYADNEYKWIKRTLQINLNNFRCNKKLKERYYLKNEESEKLTEKLEIDMVDMEIGRRMCYTKEETKLSRWCMAFTSRTEEAFRKAVDGIMEEKAREKLVDEVNKYSTDDEVIQIYTKLSKQEMEWNTYRLEEEEKFKKKIEEAKTQIKKAGTQVKKAKIQIEEKNKEIEMSNKKIEVANKKIELSNKEIEKSKKEAKRARRDGLAQGRQQGRWC